MAKFGYNFVMSLVAGYKREIFIGLSILGVYFFTRLYNLMALPIFTDEAIYTRWAQIAKYDASWRFISLTDGKQPSFIWLSMLLIPFVPDPLMAGRLVSVFSGFAALGGLFFLGWIVFRDRQVGIISALLYVLFPFGLVYDRMALYDSLLAALAVWALLFQIILARTRRLDVSLLLGMILGAGLLTKSSAEFFLFLLPVSLLFFNFKQKEKLKSFGLWLGLALLAVVLAQGYESVLRLSPLRHTIEEKNTVFIYSFSEWWQYPFRFFRGNLAGLWDWFQTYVKFPFILLISASLVLKGRSFLKEKLVLLAWFISPLIALAFFGKVLYPRFILFMTLPLLVLAAYSLYLLLKRVGRTWLKKGLVFAFILPWFWADYHILTDFARAPIPRADLEQYINSWPAGGGIKEMALFLRQESAKRPVFVATEGTFGSLPTYGVEIYLSDLKTLEATSFWPVPKEVPKEWRDKAQTQSVYLVFNQTQEPPQGWPLELVAKYQKGIGQSYLSIYRLVGN